MNKIGHLFVSSRPSRLRIGQIPLVGIGKALFELYAGAPPHLAQAPNIHELAHRPVRLCGIGTDFSLKPSHLGNQLGQARGWKCPRQCQR